MLSKQGGRRWSAPCRRLSKDARDPPHPGLGVFGVRGSTHLLRAACGDYISQQARRRLPAWESWRRPSQPSQPSQPAPLRVLPSGVGLLATQRVAFLELGSGPFRRKGRQPWLVAPSVAMKETRGCGISVVKSWRRAAASPQSRAGVGVVVGGAILNTRLRGAPLMGQAVSPESTWVLSWAGGEPLRPFFSFPPSILFLESYCSISSSPSNSSNSSSTRLITGHLQLFLRSPAGYRLHPPHPSHRPKHPPSVRTCSLNFPQGHWVPPAGRQPT